jgi:hypothetical protein
LPSLCEALGSLPSITREKKKAGSEEVTFLGGSKYF